MFVGTTLIWIVLNTTIHNSVDCKNEEGNEFDTTVVALIRDDCLKQKVVEHVPIHCIYQEFCCFLKLPGCSISATVTGKRVNRGAGNGLEIPVKYRFFEDKRAVTLVKMQIAKIENNVNDKMNRYMKSKMPSLEKKPRLLSSIRCIQVKFTSGARKSAHYI